MKQSRVLLGWLFFANVSLVGAACGDSLKYEWDPPVFPPGYDTPTVSPREMNLFTAFDIFISPT